MITKSSNKESIILSSWKNLSHIKKEKFVNKLNIYIERNNTPIFITFDNKSKEFKTIHYYSNFENYSGITGFTLIGEVTEKVTVDKVNLYILDYLKSLQNEILNSKKKTIDLFFENRLSIDIVRDFCNDDEIIAKIRSEIDSSSILSGSLYFKDINIVNYLDILLTEYPEIKSELTDLEVAKIRIYNIAIQNLGNDYEIKYPKSFKSDFSISFKECKFYVFDNIFYSDYLRKVLLFLVNEKLITDVPLSLKIQAKIKRLF